MKNKKSVMNYFCIVVMMCSITYVSISKDSDWPYILPGGDEPQGKISGKIIPSGVQCVIQAEEIGQEYGMFTVTQTNGTFMIDKLVPGIYDLVVEPVKDTRYNVLIGQHIPEEYKGTLLNNDAKDIETLTSHTIPLAFSNAYLNQSIDITKFSDKISPYFKDDIYMVKKGGILPDIKRLLEKELPISNYIQKRSILAVTGNSNKAATICMVKESVTISYYFKKYPKGSIMVSEKVNEEKTMNYTYFDLCLFEKIEDGWQLISRKPIKYKLFPFPHVKQTVKDLQIKYYTKGNIVGVEVGDNEVTDVGNVTMQQR